jgi:hypothetical protein
MVLEKQEQVKPQIGRWKEIIKVRVELNIKKTKRTFKKDK